MAVGVAVDLLLAGHDGSYSSVLLRGVLPFLNVSAESRDEWNKMKAETTDGIGLEWNGRQQCNATVISKRKRGRSSY